MLMPQRDDGCRPHLQIGARNFGRQECLELALELVIVHQPTWISAISQRLLDLQPVWWSSIFGHSNRLFCCHLPFKDGGRQIAQY